MVTEHGAAVGLIEKSRLPGLKDSDTPFRDLAEKVISVNEGTRLSDVATLLRTNAARAALVTRLRGGEEPEEVIGVITGGRVDQILSEESEFFENR